MADKHVIAVDLGAESGRVIKVRFDGRKFDSEESHRFPNLPVQVRGTLHWDALRLWHEIKAGIEKVADRASSIGLDTWGVDFALLDRDGKLLANPVHYRDSRAEGMMEWVFERVPRRTIFERTGIQFMSLNSLYHLSSLVRDNSPLLDTASTFLTIPDLFNYWLSGRACCEFTNATTTQFYNPRAGTWDFETLTAVGLPTSIFPEIVPPGTQVGEYNGIPVIAPACHDTGSAVVAIPTTISDYAYCSSGTWSLFGLELNEAVINDAAYEANVTNEGGVNGTFRFLKNVAGMWLAQQCRATWRDQGTEYSYDQLTAEAKSAQAFRSMVDPDDPLFLPPGDMPSRIREFCGRTGQPEPQSVGQVMRAVYESLALKYRYTLDKLIHITGRTVERLHVIGGGSQNALLCQMTADALGRLVIAGPAEATALGNAIVQFIALGEIGSIGEAREILSRTIGTVQYEPQNAAAWEDAYERYRDLVTTN
jgi:sugar (pentulose or hexulose) kinase